ncbi:MAG TPA: hypothetical protein VIQ54_21490 [Polyangia bacterium]
MKVVVGALGLLALAAYGCGGDDGSSFSCLIGSGTSQLCIDTRTNVPGDADCGTGVLVDACLHEGADGGCVHAFSSGGTSLTQTIWYYSGTAATTSQEMVDCSNNGGTWIQP